MAGVLAAGVGRPENGGSVDAMTGRQWAAWIVINAVLLLAVLAMTWLVTR